MHHKLTNSVVRRWCNFKAKPHPRYLECGFVVTPTGFIKRLKVFFSWCIEEELHAIYNCDLSVAPHFDRLRDIFVFQCCIGCRVGDLVRLTKADIINGAVEYIASKTIKENQKTILVPINTIASSHMARRTFVGNLDWFNSADGVRRIKLSFIM